MPPRKWDLRIRDILASIERIIEYTRTLDFEQFRSDTKTFDAVVRNFEIIGEAAAHVPEEIVANHPEIPWQDMRDMRNVLAHEYFGINENIVWNTIQDDLLPWCFSSRAFLKRKAFDDPVGGIVESINMSPFAFYAQPPRI